jgi:hypothetical protein
MTSLALLASLLSAGCGTDPAESCAAVCAKNAECQPDGPGEDACQSLCEEQSKDERYAEAMELQAECYDEGWSCAELAGGICATPE